MKLTILIPIIHFNEYSRRAMRNLSDIPRYDNLVFLFVISDEDVKSELESLIKGISNSYDIIVANSYSSNKLRSYAVDVRTEYFYFHDCDDVADYNFLNSYIETINDTSTVYCFNVNRVEIENNIEKKASLIYNHYKEGPIKKIENLQVSVYSKFIPAKFAQYIDYPDLPFTQDWAISYSLFLVAPHSFDRRNTYTYFLYGNSSSNSRHDTVRRLNKVNAYSRSIISKYIEKNLIREADFIGFRYNTALSPRYARLGINIKPYIIRLSTFICLNNRTKMAFIYQSFKRFMEWISKGNKKL